MIKDNFSKIKMTKTKEKTRLKRKFHIYHKIGFLTIMILAIGTGFYHFYEGWAWVDALYFSATTLTTIGYGDLLPTTSFSKIFTVVYIFIGIGIIFTFINHLIRNRTCE